jgi:hypothetical protein
MPRNTGATAMKLVQFQDANGVPVYINPAQVGFVRRVLISGLEGPVGQFTEVGTTSGIVRVAPAVSEVVKKLR